MTGNYCKNCGARLRKPAEEPDGAKDGAGGSGSVKPKGKAQPTDDNAGGTGGKKVAKKAVK